MRLAIVAALIAVAIAACAPKKNYWGEISRNVGEITRR